MWLGRIPGKYMGILVKNALFNMSSNVKYYRRMKDNEEKGAFGLRNDGQ